MFSFKGGDRYNNGLDYKCSAVLCDDCSIQPVLFCGCFFFCCLMGMLLVCMEMVLWLV